MQSARRRSSPVAGRALAGPLAGATGIGRLHPARPGPVTVPRPSETQRQRESPGPAGTAPAGRSARNPRSIPRTDAIHTPGKRRDCGLCTYPYDVSTVRLGNSIVGCERGEPSRMYLFNRPRRSASQAPSWWTQKGRGRLGRPPTPQAPQARGAQRWSRDVERPRAFGCRRRRWVFGIVTRRPVTLRDGGAIV